MDTKKPWMSKTIWVSVLSVVLPFIPAVNAWVIANPEAYSALLGLLFGGLRTISSDKIALKGN